jgi:gliding motility-associated protein GldC
MNKDKISDKKNISLNIGLDDKKTPVYIDWLATDAENEQPIECKAMLLSLFDKDHRDTFKIDLWTNEMQVIEMDKFMFQTLKGLAETYFKATNNSQLSNDFMRFVQYFGEKTEVLPK